jgi:hypothetical protein
MNKIIGTPVGKRALHFLAGSALLMFASLSHAQYVWVDEKGIKQFSDRSPPSNIPAKNILKAPRGHAVETTVAPAAPAAAPAAAAMSVADREADYKKRQLAKAETDKKAANEAANASYKKAVCDSARAQKAQLESGVRLRTGANGDYMDDKQRAQETAGANKTLADCR